MTRGVFLLFINLLLLKGNKINVNIWCQSNDVRISNSKDGFQFKSLIDRDHSSDVIIIPQVPLFSKLKFIVPSNIDWSKCTVENEEDKKLSETNQKKHWRFVNYHDFEKKYEVWEYLSIRIGNYFNGGKIEFNTNYVKKLHHKEYFELGRIINVRDYNKHKMISIQMNIKINEIKGNIGNYCMIFALSNQNYYEVKAAFGTFLPRIYVEIIDKSFQEFNIIVMFDSKQFIVKGTLENEIYVRINMYPMNGMYAVKFNHNPNPPLYYRWEKQDLFFEELLTIWIGQQVIDKIGNINIQAGIDGYITDLKIKDKILPCGLNEYQSNGCQTNTIINTDQKIQTIDTETHDVKIQTIQTETHEMDIQTSNDLEMIGNDPIISDNIHTESSKDDIKHSHTNIQTNANPRTTTAESESTPNNDSKNHSNKSGLHIIIICSTVGIIISLLTIFIIMTCRRKKIMAKISSKKTNIEASSTKKVDSVSDKIIHVNTDLPKIPPPPPQIFMNDYIDSPRIKQFYKTPQYKQQRSRKSKISSQQITREGKKSTNIPPPPPMNMKDGIDVPNDTNQKTRQFRSTNDPY